MTIRTLVVDDVAAVASLHGRFVSAHPDCELVGIAASGPEAVAAIRRLSPDLVLLDVHLPGFSGIEVLRAVRADETLVQPEIVAVTAARDVGTVRDARFMGVRHYLVKPFTAHDLHERIDDVIAAGRSSGDASSDLDQSAIDAVMRPSGRRTLPKGLSRETLDLVHASLIRLTSGTAVDVAADLGLSRVSCRRYLEHLADEGAARRTMDYSTAGRPSTRYLVAAATPPE